MRTAVICHADNVWNRGVVPRFLSSFSDLVGIVEIVETPAEARADRRRRIRREWRRSRLRLLDVLAFRLWYRLRHAARDAAWIEARAAAEQARFPELPPDLPVHRTADPNDDGVRAWLEQQRPDVVLVACKHILRPEIFSVPARGTFVVHPGICPEYRNAHGCFWALALRDLEKVGATLLRIDAGVDTGPVHAHYRTEVDELRESHVVIQLRVVYDNLHAIRADLERIGAGEAQPLDTAGRESAAWGQPRLTDYVRWKRAARSSRKNAAIRAS